MSPRRRPHDADRRTLPLRRRVSAAAIRVPVHATVTTTTVPADLPLDVATMSGEEMLPWLREIEGFHGLVMLTNETDKSTLVVTFWESREIAERHRAARERFRKRITETVEVRVEAATDYAVTFAELDPFRVPPTS